MSSSEQLLEQLGQMGRNTSMRWDRTALGHSSLWRSLLIAIVRNPSVFYKDPLPVINLCKADAVDRHCLQLGYQEKAICRKP
jgi:hypothetical protein